MTDFIKNFDSYRTIYWSVKTLEGTDISSATIVCYDGNVRVGTLEFEDYPLRWNSISGDEIFIHFHISRFNDIVTFIRYEKPLQLWFDDRKKRARIQNAIQEPVGEQE
jgi:hypothetical protein